MPVDPTGTRPGLQPQAPEPKTHNMRCKNKNCDSMQVVEINIPGNQGRRLYRCVKCHTTWGIPVGGAIDI